MARRVEVLGPVRIQPASEATDLLMAKERALLAYLALHVGRTVSLGDLEVALWGEHPPAKAPRSLQAHVSRLRHCLDPDAIVTEPHGYRLAMTTDDVDATRLESLVHAAGEIRRRDGPTALHRRLLEAEGLWRGEPLTDLADTPQRQAQGDRLRELWREARDERIRVELDLGEPERVLGEIQRLVTEEPLREPLWGLLMLALYRSRRQLDALHAYQQMQSLLGQEWGVDPSRALQRLQWQILRQDPQLDAAPPLPPLHVPAALTSFVGRTGQVDKILADLSRERLVTLRGPAGVGKSRLALEVARAARAEFPEGVWWVDLTAARDRESAVEPFIRALGVEVPAGVEPDKALQVHLHNRETLLVLDNCEQIVGALAQIVMELLTSAPGLRILATSRIHLRVEGEARREVAPLAVPPVGAGDREIAQSDSVALFLQQRPHRVDDRSEEALSDVAAVCRRLDGLPLALELAASRAPFETVRETLARLDRMALDTTPSQRSVSPTAHHAMLATAINWSYAALDPHCQQVFDVLSVFPADFDRPAALAVASGGAGGSRASAERCIDHLLDASLLQSTPVRGSTRYRLLYVMREFARDRLAERGGVEVAWQAFSTHYREWAVQAALDVNGTRPGSATQAIMLEQQNLRAALDWSRRHEPPARTAALLPVMLRVLWGISPTLRADVALMRAVLESAEAAPIDLRAWGWEELVTAAYESGDQVLASAASHKARDLFQRAHDRVGLATNHWHRGGFHLLATGDLVAAQDQFEQGRALGRTAGAPVAEMWCCAHLVQLDCFVGTVTPETRQALTRAEQLADPDDGTAQGHLAMNRALLAYADGDMEACLGAARRCVALSQEVGVAAYEMGGLLLTGAALLRTGSDWALGPVLRAARQAVDSNDHLLAGVAFQELARIADISEHAVVAAQLWGAGTARAPVWPVFAADFDPAGARAALRERFAEEVGVGSALSAEQALNLGIG